MTPEVNGLLLVIKAMLIFNVACFMTAEAQKCKISYAVTSGSRSSVEFGLTQQYLHHDLWVGNRE